MRSAPIVPAFAVLADKVRELARRIQNSAEEIKTVIFAVGKSGMNVQCTPGLARAADEALIEIRTRIEQISERTTVIAATAEQRSQMMKAASLNLAHIMEIR